MRALTAACLAVCIGAACLPVFADEAVLGDPCDIVPWQTVNNGMGAEAGVVREFATLITIPAGCMRGGKTWVPRILLGVTRLAGAATDMDVRVSLRAVQSPVQGPPVPGDFRTDPASFTLPGVPEFPAQAVFDLEAGPGANRNLNNILWGDQVFVSVDMDGDKTANQFVVADQVGPTDMGCFTGMGGNTPADPCTTGNPLLSDLGAGAASYTFYGRYIATSESIDGREPLGNLWGARYLDPGFTGGPTNLRVWRDSPLSLQGGDETICQFSNVPDDFEFQCPMSSSQLASLGAGEVFVELTGGTSLRNTRMIPADRFVFADGFESGDASVWSLVVP